MECLGHWFFKSFNVYIFLKIKPVKYNKTCLLVNPGFQEGSFWQLKKKKKAKLNLVKLIVLTLFCYYAANTVEKSPIFWLGRRLVIDELDLDSLHGGHGKNGL